MKATDKVTKVTGYKGHVTAKDGGLLIGGVAVHNSAAFCNASGAVRWTVVVVDTNRKAGRQCEPGEVEEVQVSRRQIVHACQNGSACILRGEVSHA